MKLSILQELTLLFWYITENPRYDSFYYYRQIGLLPKYAFEATKNAHR